MNGVETPMGRGRSKPICALLAGAVLAMVVTPVAFAGAAGNPEATASAAQMDLLRPRPMGVSTPFIGGVSS